MIMPKQPRPLRETCGEVLIFLAVVIVAVLLGVKWVRDCGPGFFFS